MNRVRRCDFDSAQPVPVEIPIPARGWRRREIVLAGALVIAIGCAVFFMTRLWRVEQGDRSSSSAATANWTPALREFWEPLLSSSRRLVVCVATPLFVKVPGFGVVREPSINDWDDVPASKRLSSVEGALQAGISEPSYSYTEVGTATGAFLLGQFLAPRKQAVLITRANVLSWPEIAEDNVIFLGPATGIHQTEDIPTEAQLVLDPTGHPQLESAAGRIGVYPGSSRGRRRGGRRELCADQPRAGDERTRRDPDAFGNQISSVMGGVQAFTNPALAQMLVSRLKTASGSIPKYFQVVLSVKAMDDVPVKIDYVFHRELPDRGMHSTAK